MNKNTKILIGVVAALAIIAGCLAIVVMFGILGDPNDGSSGGQVPVEPTVAPTEVPPPAVESYIIIDEPTQGTILNIENAVEVKGRAGGLPEGNVVVEALANGQVLAQQPTTIRAPDAGTGGEGPWSVTLDIDVAPGTPGQIRAFSPSPKDNSVIAEARVDVVFGQPETGSAPVAVISAPSEAEVGESVLFDASASKSESRIVSYAWDLGDGTTANAVEIEHAYGAPGIYNVTLTVTNKDDLSDTTNTQITITATEPEPTDTPEPVPTEEPGGGEIEGVNWILDNTIVGTEITALFEGGTVSGSSGCNTYNAAYVIDGNNISISQPASTQMMCEEDIMQQEARYLSALVGAQQYQVRGDDQLRITGGGTLNYTAQ